jgi:hypothetical protein
VPVTTAGQVYHHAVRPRPRPPGLLAAVLGLAVYGATTVARANPCPCREQWVAGRHLYVAAPQKNVRIESEALLFQVQRPTSWLRHVVVEVTVDYLLVNRGGARELVIGFPVGEVHEVEGEISSFQVHGDGVGPRVMPDASEQKVWVAGARPAECEGDTTTDAYREGYDWFLWTQTLRPGPNRLRVRYLQRWFVQDGEVTVHYVLRTADHWGNGRIGQLHVELRDPDLPPKVRWKTTPRPTELRDRGRLLVWSLSNHHPMRDLELQAKFIPGPEDHLDD